MPTCSFRNGGTRVGEPPEKDDVGNGVSPNSKNLLNLWLSVFGRPGHNPQIVRATSLPIDSAKRGIIVRWCFIRADCSV